MTSYPEANVAELITAAHAVVESTEGGDRDMTILNLADSLAELESLMTPHEAIIIQAGTAGWPEASPQDGYLVQCPRGCNLGLSRVQADRKGAKRRVELHRLTTTQAGRKS